MVVIGMTGGIGAGKSYVADILRMRGIPVYDSDSRARLITANDRQVKAGLTALAGEALYAGGVFHKEILAEFIFGNNENMEYVNGIIHPRVKDDFRQWTGTLAGYDICVLESAILFESGFDRITDLTVCVDAPLELRLQRCMKRDNTDRSSILKRIRSQMDQDEKCRMADYVIVNENVHDLESQIDALIEKVRKTIDKKTELC